MTSDQAGTIWVVSTRDPDGQPACQITWGPDTWHAPVAAVRQTAMDLVTCAAYAEMMRLLITRAGLPIGTVRDFTTDMLRQAGRTRAFGTNATIDLIPAGGKNKKGRREALVLVARGTEQGMVTADEARRMALQWLLVAEATESDQLVSEALRATRLGSAEDADTLFAYLRELRK